MITSFPSAWRTIWINTDNNMQGASRVAHQDQVPVQSMNAVDTDKISYRKYKTIRQRKVID